MNIFLLSVVDVTEELTKRQIFIIQLMFILIHQSTKQTNNWITEHFACCTCTRALVASIISKKWLKCFTKKWSWNQNQSKTSTRIKTSPQKAQYYNNILQHKGTLEFVTPFLLEWGTHVNKNVDKFDELFAFKYWKNIRGCQKKRRRNIQTTHLPSKTIESNERILIVCI